MPEDHFGDEIAARYDDPSDEMFQPAAIEPVVDFLAALAGDGAAVELGIGTGRIALPLAQRGVEVHGIDLSSAMVARLRAKPGGDRIPVAIGDFATARAGARSRSPTSSSTRSTTSPPRTLRWPALRMSQRTSSPAATS
jgi:predicted RNA methylase